MSVSGWIGAGTLVFVVALGAFATLRDKLLEIGLDRPRRLLHFLQRTSHRAAARRITRDAALLGAEFFDHSGNAIDVALSSKKIPSDVRKRPDQHLVAALKDWTIDLGEGIDFRGLRHYVNTMGGVSYSEDKEAQFATIAHAWITALQAANQVPPFDCLLGIKDGNPLLVHSVKRRMCRSEDRPVRSVFCKGQNDSARVSRGPHETDFEGLRAFRDDRPIARAADGRYRAIAVDDNCASGQSLLDAIRRFNEFVADHQDDYPFAPIDTAVVLFAVETGAPRVFDDTDSVTLHALVALGDDQMKALRSKSQRQLRSEVETMKASAACSFSRTLELAGGSQLVADSG
jgi:hypothetical protein